MNKSIIAYIIFWFCFVKNMRAFLFLLILLVLSSCGGGDKDHNYGYGTRNAEQNLSREERREREALRQQLLSSLNTTPDTETTQTDNNALPLAERGYQTVALFAPFSGSEASLGLSLQKAASLALFEHPDVRINLLSVDTAAGIQKALELAKAEKSQAIIGPVRASEVMQISAPLRGLRASVFSLSNSQNIARGGRSQIFPMGFVPEDQVQVILDALKAQGRRNIAVIAPENNYGRLITELVVEYTSKNTGLFLQQSLLYPPSLQDFTGFISKLVNIDAVLVAPVKSQNLRIIAAQLDGVNLAAPNVQIAGLQLWDNFGALEKEPSLNEAIWVSAKNNRTEEFRKKYRGIFKQEPHGLASISYDLMKMMIAQSRNGSLTFRPNLSFSGINGEFSLLKNGTVKRNYYLRQIKNGQDRLLR